MVILMGKGSIEAKYGLIGLKGLRRAFQTIPVYSVNDGQESLTPIGKVCLLSQFGLFVLKGLAADMPILANSYHPHDP